MKVNILKFSGMHVYHKNYIAGIGECASVYKCLTRYVIWFICIQLSPHTVSIHFVSGPYPIPSFFFQLKCSWFTMFQQSKVLQFYIFFIYTWVPLVARTVKNLPAMCETQLRTLGWEDPLEKEMTTHSTILAWRIAWTENPGELQSMG